MSIVYFLGGIVIGGICMLVFNRKNFKVRNKENENVSKNNADKNVEESSDESEEESVIKSVKELKLVLCARKDLGMSKGKLGGDCGRTVLMVYKKAVKKVPKWVKQWEVQGQMKVVLGVNSEEQLLQLESKAEEANLSCGHISEKKGNELTASILGIFGPVEEVNKITGDLKLL